YPDIPPAAPMSDPIAALHRFTAPAEPLDVLLIGFERLDADALRARLARLAQRTPIPRDLEVVVCPTAGDSGDWIDAGDSVDPGDATDPIAAAHDGAAPAGSSWLAAEHRRCRFRG